MTRHIEKILMNYTVFWDNPRKKVFLYNSVQAAGGDTTSTTPPGNGAPADCLALTFATIVATGVIAIFYNYF